MKKEIFNLFNFFFSLFFCIFSYCTYYSSIDFRTELKILYGCRIAVKLNELCIFWYIIVWNRLTNFVAEQNSKWIFSWTISLMKFNTFSYSTNFLLKKLLKFLECLFACVHSTKKNFNKKFLKLKKTKLLIWKTLSNVSDFHFPWKKNWQLL